MDYYDLYDITPEQEEKMERERLVIQEGGFYLNRRGDQLGPMEERTPGHWIDQYGTLYHPNGVQWDHVGTSTGNIDLTTFCSEVEWGYQAEMRGVNKMTLTKAQRENIEAVAASIGTPDEPAATINVGLDGTARYHDGTPVELVHATHGDRPSRDALIPLVANLIGDLTGLTPPPATDFPPEMQPAIDRFLRDLGRLSEAEGRLSAAAPLMLAALRRIASGESDNAMKDAARAIAKAEATT